MFRWFTEWDINICSMLWQVVRYCNVHWQCCFLMLSLHPSPFLYMSYASVSISNITLSFQSYKCWMKLQFLKETLEFGLRVVYNSFFFSISVWIHAYRTDLVDVLSSSPCKTAGVIAAENIKGWIIRVGPQRADHFHKHWIYILLLSNAWVTHCVRNNIKTNNGNSGTLITTW